MPDERGVVREIAWRECFPWLRLFDTLRFALKVRMLLPAAAGVLLTVFGWWLIGWVFSGTSDSHLTAWIESYGTCPWKAGEMGGSMPTPPTLAPGGPFEPAAIGRFPASGTSPFTAAWWTLSAPARQLFDPELTFTGLAFLLLCLLWGLAVWALVGGVLTRMAAMQLGREEGIGWGHALRYVRSKWPSYASAPMLPLLGVLLAAIPMAVGGLMLRWSVSALVIGIAWPLMLAGGLLMVVFLIGLCFGWPLMWAAISTEGTDNFDALSRSYSYVYQRPLKYLAYAALAAVLSMLGGMLALGVAEAVIHLTNWAAGWGAGEPVGEWIARTRKQDGFESWAPSLIWFWHGCVRLVALGFVYSFFWTASSAIYLLLRQDVDGTEFDEIYVEDSGEVFDSPALTKDAAGVPIVADDEGEASS